MSVEFDRVSPGSLTQGLLIGTLLMGGLGVTHDKQISKQPERFPRAVFPFSRGAAAIGKGDKMGSATLFDDSLANEAPTIVAASLYRYE